MRIVLKARVKGVTPVKESDTEWLERQRNDVTPYGGEEVSRERK